MGWPTAWAACASCAYRFDLPGVIVFMVAMLALQVVVTQGSTLGWASPFVIVLMVDFVAAAIAFFRIESGNAHGFVDFGLFGNLAIREAAMVALGFNLLMVVVAIGSILLTIPAGRREK